MKKNILFQLYEVKPAKEKRGRFSHFQFEFTSWEMILNLPTQID